MFEAITVPSLVMMTVIVTEESLAMDRHTYTHRHDLVDIKIKY